MTVVLDTSSTGHMPRFTYLYVDRMLVFAIHLLMLIASGTRRLDPDLGTLDAPEHGNAAFR